MKRKIVKYNLLYNRNSAGKPQECTVRVVQVGANHAQIITHTGLVGGKLTPNIQDIKVGKNIGKANETTPWQQAKLEARSYYKGQKKKGYKSFIDLGFDKFSADINDKSDSKHKIELLDRMLPKFNTDDNDGIKVMKAQPYFDPKTGKNKAKYPMIIQPKINGVRSTKNEEKFRSKEGLDYVTITHITKELADVDYTVDGLPFEFDGELYIPNTPLQEIASAVKKLSLLSGQVKYYIFDIAVTDITQEARINFLDNWFNSFGGGMQKENVVRVPSYIVNNHEEVMYWHKQFKAQGYEGSILRDPKAIYKFGQRPKTMLKLKDVIEQEFIIVDVVDTDKAPGLGQFKCRNDRNGEIFDVVPKGTHDKRRQYLEDRENLIGKLLTVQYYERTAAPKEVPFHAKGIVVRDYE